MHITDSRRELDTSHKNSFPVTEQELESCNFVKTILMLIVVLYHCMLFWRGNWFNACEPVYKSENIPIITKWFNSFHVYAFTLVSGYIFYALKTEKDKYGKYSDFIYNKLRRLIIPYVLVAIVWVIPIHIYFWGYNGQQIVDKYLFAIDPDQLWFLWMLFDVFILIWPLSNVIKNNRYALLIAISSFIIGSVCKKIIPNYYCILTALVYFPFFILGMKVREYRELIAKKNISCYIYIFADIIIFIALIHLENIYIKKLLNFILNIIGALMAFFCLQKLANNLNWRSSKHFTLLCKYSMLIYLFHQQLVYFCNWYLNGVIRPIAHSTINFVIVMFFSCILIKILENINFKNLS